MRPDRRLIGMDTAGFRVVRGSGGSERRGCIFTMICHPQHANEKHVHQHFGSMGS